MKEQVTVVPADTLLSVNGECLRFSFRTPEGVHAIQWHNGAGHIEYINAAQPNTLLSGTADYAAHVAPFVSLWETEKVRLEAEANTSPTLEEKAVQVRAQRDELIAATDYLMMPDYPISEAVREAVVAYRQTLRDVPDQTGFPDAVVWPEKPKV